MLHLIAGPAGGGKSGVAAAMLAAGEVDVVADVTALWAALSGAVRDENGLYPVRLDDDPALRIARYVQRAAVRQALRNAENVAATTSQRFVEEQWQRLADEELAEFQSRIVDPGRAVVVARLSDANGVLSNECARAIARWYG